ncbi:MAG: hypothetical protein IJ802_04475, partial [Kiritimatiellae bacterium]|nr:hypothetical protein [Kiritimatiellia bacterium]
LFDACLFEYPVNKIYSRSFLAANAIRFTPSVCPGEDTLFNLSCVLAGARWRTVPICGYIYYRMDGTSLSRHLPHAAASRRAVAEAWGRYIAANPSAAGLFPDAARCTEADMVRVEWSNIWRRNSPVSIAGRWRFARANKSVLGNPLAAFCKKASRTFLRNVPGVLPLRRRHIQRLYPNVRRMGDVEFDTLRGI